MPEPITWSLQVSVGIFVAAALLIGVFGKWLTALADQLADRTGLGEALMGAFFLGAATSTPEIVTSVTAAATNHPELAVSNALGGIATQTVFLAIADLTYRRANLEHAAASSANIMLGTLMLVMLALVLLAGLSPNVAVWGIHPATPILIVAYLYGLRLVFQAQTKPMWVPQKTLETREDRPQAWPLGPGLPALWTRLAVAVGVVGLGGWLVAKAGVGISDATGITETVVGALFTALSTSLPELVTAMAAVHRGALTMAVGGVLGGNAFDSLLTAFSDVAYRQGSVFHAVSDRQTFLVAVGILMTSILLMGLIGREKHGLANIGFGSVLMLVVYLGAMMSLVLA